MDVASVAARHDLRVAELASHWRSRPRQSGWTAARYREQFGWDAAEHGRRTLMSLGRGIVAVAVPAHLAPHVASELKRRDADGPAMAVSDFLPRWLYLAEHEGIVVDSDTLPAGVMVFDCPSTIQLPAVDTHVDQLRWVVPPDPQRRWLPTLAAVLCAVGSRARFACRQRPERRPQLDIPEEGIGYA